VPVRKLPFVIFTILFSYCALGQNSQDETLHRILAEGRKLYISEMASWYGTDIFLEKYNDRENVGGYFSYADGSGIKNIFFSKGLVPKVIYTITFDSTFNVRTAKVDTIKRDFNKTEENLYVIRSRAYLAIDADTLFKNYERTNFNLVPLISGGEKKVYVLTAPKENGVVIFGNDYLITFDSTNNLVSKKKLHKNIISAKYGIVDGKETGDGFHTHLPETGDFITPTDICTILLYEKIAKWRQYIVASKDFFTIWNCITDIPLMLTTKEAKAFSKHNGRKRKKN
jgi:hypothetical protein